MDNPIIEKYKSFLNENGFRTHLIITPSPLLLTETLTIIDDKTGFTVGNLRVFSSFISEWYNLKIIDNRYIKTLYQDFMEGVIINGVDYIQSIFDSNITRISVPKLMYEYKKEIFDMYKQITGCEIICMN